MLFSEPLYYDLHELISQLLKEFVVANAAKREVAREQTTVTVLCLSEQS